jgi:hypothetical protein
MNRSSSSCPLYITILSAQKNKLFSIPHCLFAVYQPVYDVYKQLIHVFGYIPENSRRFIHNFNGLARLK